MNQETAQVKLRVRVRRIGAGMALGRMLTWMFPWSDAGYRAAIWWTNHFGVYEWQIENGRWWRERIEVCHE